MEEKKSTYKTGLTLLHSHRETQVAEERIKVNGVPACADTKVGGKSQQSLQFTGLLGETLICEMPFESIFTSASSQVLRGPSAPPLGLLQPAASTPSDLTAVDAVATTAIYRASQFILLS